MINEIFTDMDNVMEVYIDNLMIFTKTENQAEHNKIILKVLRRLEENDLFMKPKKCMFCATEVDFLGMIVGHDGIKMDHVTILFLGSALFLISSFCATSPFPGSLSYAYHHYLLILGPLTFTIYTL